MSGDGILVDWVGSEESRLDEQIRDDTLNSADIQEGGFIGPGRFWILVHSDTRFFNLNGNNMMNDSLLQTSDDSMNSTSGLKSSLLT